MKFDPTQYYSHPIDTAKFFLPISGHINGVPLYH